MTSSTPHKKKRSPLIPWIIVAISVNLGLLMAYPIALMVQKHRSENAVADQADRLVSQTTLIWRSHPDPDSARTYQANVEANNYVRMVDRKIPVKTETFGMREDSYQVPKDPDTIRVIALGDSYVFGLFVNAEDRLGVFLEEYLNEKAPIEGKRYEVLHFGTPSWNIQGECEYLRRRLSRLQPDLILHYVMYNDLNDCVGLRGFGGSATFTPQRRGVGDSLIQYASARFFLGSKYASPLVLGLDGESRSRYQQAKQRIERLARTAKEQDIPYALFVNWARNNSVARDLLVPDSVLAYYFSFKAMNRRDFRAADNDFHWSRDGHEHVALTAYHVIAQNSLLPHSVPSWGRARDAFEMMCELDVDPAPSVVIKNQLLSDLNFLDMESAAVHVYGGIDIQRQVSPSASLCVRVPSEATKLKIVGQSFDRPEFSPTVEVWVEDQKVGTLSPKNGDPISESFECSEILAKHEFVNVRFVSNDYVYALDNRRHCIVFEISRLTLE